MDDLSFLDTPDDRIQGNATLKVVLENGDVCLISDRIYPYLFLDRCPLLYYAFEYDVHGHLQASIEASSETGLISLLRFCYTGNYLPPNADYGPNLLFPHVEMYKIAEDFDCPELQLLAHGNFSCQVEFACCVPAPPPDLLETIQFVYRHYSSPQARRQHGLVDTLLNYSVSKFVYHKLGENADFIKIAAEVPEFRQDLCRTNMERNFEDECAFDIVRLCLDTLQVQPCISPQALASKDEPQEMFHRDNIDTTDESENEVMSDAVPAAESETYRADAIIMADSFPTTLAHRPKLPQPEVMDYIETPSSDEEDGFTMVTVPNPPAPTTPESVMSSPEIVPTPVIDILAATGTDYSSDNDWDML